MTTVGAVTDQGKHAPYSKQGSNLWVCAPSDPTAGIRLPTPDDRPGITTTDNDDVYIDDFGGTSAAARSPVWLR